MRIVAATTFTPFASGDDAIVANDLADALRRNGETADTVHIPFCACDTDLPGQLLAIRLFDLSECNLLITIGFPANLLRHPNKIAWLTDWRPFVSRQLTGGDDLHELERLQMGQAAVRAGRRGVAEARRVYTNSGLVSNALRALGGIDSLVLYPPLRDAEDYRCYEFGDYVLLCARANNMAGQRLAVEAFRYVTPSLRLVIMGYMAGSETGQPLRDLIADHGLGQRVEFVASSDLASKQRMELFGRALACMDLCAGDEPDTHTLLEAFHSRKAVITSTDSAASQEFVQHGDNGLVVSPEPHILAQVINGLASGRSYAEQLGKAARTRVRELRISWEHVTGELTR